MFWETWPCWVDLEPLPCLSGARVDMLLLVIFLTHIVHLNKFLMFFCVLVLFK
jgi:hypothetical protein